MKPRVLHVAAFANPSGGGFVSSLARLGKDDAFDTALLCPRTSARFAWTRRLEEHGVRMLYASSPLDVAASIVRAAPDVVHAHFVEWMVPAAVGATTCGARIAWHFHSGVSAGVRKPHAVRRLKYASAKRIVERYFCVSSDVVEYLLQYGVPASRIAELPNGVDLEYFRPPSLRERAAARRRFGIAPRDRVLVFFGRDAEIKGSDRLAAALDTMQTRPRILLVAASERSKELLAAHDVIDAGQLADVREAYWAGDALALPSRAETVTYALLEARGCALPGVASPLPGITGAFSADDGVAISDPQRPSLFGRAVADACERGSAPLRAELHERYSLDTWAHRLERWYVAEPAA